MLDSIESSLKQARAKDPMERAAVPKKSWMVKKKITARSSTSWRTWRSAKPGTARPHGVTCGRLSWSRMCTENGVMFNRFYFISFLGVLQSLWKLCHLQTRLNPINPVYSCTLLDHPILRIVQAHQDMYNCICVCLWAKKLRRRKSPQPQTSVDYFKRCTIEWPR